MQHYMNRRAIPATLLWAYHIDDDGICNVCRAYDAAFDAERVRLQLTQLIVGARAGGAVVAFSGGKDSLSTLYIAKERLGLDVVAFLFDNGFMPSVVGEPGQAV